MFAAALLVGGASATYQFAKHHRKRDDEKFLEQNAVQPSTEECTQIRHLAMFVVKIYDRDKPNYPPTPSAFFNSFLQAQTWDNPDTGAVHHSQTRSLNPNVSSALQHSQSWAHQSPSWAQCPDRSEVHQTPSHMRHPGPSVTHQSPSQMQYPGPSVVYQSPSQMQYPGPSVMHQSPSPMQYPGPSGVHQSRSQMQYQGPSVVYQNPSQMQHPGPNPMLDQSPSQMQYPSPSVIHQNQSQMQYPSVPHQSPFQMHYPEPGIVHQSQLFLPKADSVSTVYQSHLLMHNPGPHVQDSELRSMANPSVEHQSPLQVLHNPDPAEVRDYKYSWSSGVSEEEERKVGIAYHLEPGVYSQRPRLIIAARGTIVSNYQDILDDILVGFHGLRTSPRYQKAEELIVRLVKKFRQDYGGDDPSDIWITGHSLGADIVLTAGMRLAGDQNVPQKVCICCFNGPLLTALSLIETLFLIKKMKRTALTVMDMLGEMSQRMKSVTNGYLHLKDVIKVELAYLLDPEELVKQLKQFQELQMGPVWMCVNKGDKICREFFQFYRRNHEQERLHLSCQNFFSKVIGMEHEPEYFRMPRSVTMYLNEEVSEWNQEGSEGSHLVPWVEAHRVKQWCSDKLKMKKIEFKLG